MQTKRGTLLRYLPLALVAVLPLSGLAAAEPSQPLRCELKILDPKGQPLRDAVVEAFRGPDWRSPTDMSLRLESRATTGANGMVAFTSTNRGSYLFVAHHAGLSLGWNTWYPGWPGLPDDDTPLEITLTSPTSISGIVQLPDGKPVPGAMVWVSRAFQPSPLGEWRKSWASFTSRLGRQFLSARSGADGRFRIEGLPANATLELTAAKPGLAPEQPPMAFFSPEVLSGKAGQTDAVVTLGPAGAIEGQLVQEDTGAPVPGVSVFIGEAASQTDTEPAVTGPDGRFRLADLYPGECQLRAVVGTNQFADWICETVATTVEAGLTNREVKITASRGAVLTVTVRDQASGQPVKGASIWANRDMSAVTAITSDQGTAWLRVPPGDYHLNVMSEGYSQYQSPLTLEKGQTNQFPVELEMAPRLTGTVVGPDGKPAAKVSVSGFPLSLPAGEKKTDAQGRFTLVYPENRFGNMQSSPRTLIARDLAHDLAVAAEVEPEVTNATLKLEPALTLAGRVTDVQGQAITNAQAQVMFKTEHMSSSFGQPVRADVEGRFALKGLPPGRPYAVSISAQGYGPQTRQVEGGESQHGRVELETFQLPAANARIAGVVMDADGKPVAGASVNGHGENQPYLNGRTDAKGRFSFAHVCAGQISLSANGPRGSGFGGANAEAGETNIVIQLGASQSFSGSGKLAKLTGSVTGPDGQPAPKVSVLLFPLHGVERQSDEQGRFKLSYSADQYSRQQALVLVARDPAHNLAAALELDPEATNATLKLEPGLTLAGRIIDAQDKPVTNAEVLLTFWSEHMGSTLGKPLRVDAQGRFELKGLPPGRRYGVNVSAKGFARDDRTLEATDTEARRLELEPFHLAVADQRIAGVVTDADDKPVSGASVSIYGEKQASLSGRSDRQGRFSFNQLTAGQVQVSANDMRGGSGSVVAEAGETNVVVQLGVNQSLGSSRSVTRVGGTVIDPEGKPVPRATISLFPSHGNDKQSDAQGRFKLVFSPNEWGGSQDSPNFLVVRHVARNLAAALEVEPGVTNAELKLQPGLTLAGRITGPAGQAIADAQVQLMFRTEHMSASLGSSVRPDAQGRFEFKALPAGSSYTVDVSAKGFSRESRQLDPKDTETARLELEPFQLAVADQRLAGKVIDADDKPVPGASVNLYGDKQTSQNSRTDSKGQFAFDKLSAGEVRLSANSPRGGGFGNITAQAGDTNVVLQFGTSASFGGSGKPSRLSGLVTDGEGKPAPKVRVSLFPFSETEKQTDAEGRFKLTFNPSQWGGNQDMTYVLIARDVARNLATAVEVERDATNADLKLEKGFTLTGKVTDAKGKPVAGADASVMFRAGRMSSSLGNLGRANSEGRFEIKALPPGCRYSVSVSAKGFGRESQSLEAAQADSPTLELEPFQLVTADQPLAGVVLDSEDRPVVDAWVNVYGEKQPSLSGRSDSKGHFYFARVCAGPVQLSANGQRGGYANLRAEGGDTNLTVHLSGMSGFRPAEPRRVSLRGKPLPNLLPVGFKTSDAPEGQPVLAVLIDAEQRLSRHAVKVLGEQATALKEKHVAVVVLVANSMSEEAFKEWQQETSSPFPVARFKGEPEKARAAWGASTLPWLVLSDAAHRVIAEGFPVEDLDAKLTALKN